MGSEPWWPPWFESSTPHVGCPIFPNKRGTTLGIFSYPRLCQVRGFDFLQTSIEGFNAALSAYFEHPCPRRVSNTEPRGLQLEMFTHDQGHSADSIPCGLHSLSTSYFAGWKGVRTLSLYTRARCTPNNVKGFRVARRISRRVLGTLATFAHSEHPNSFIREPQVARRVLGTAASNVCALCKRCGP